MDGIKVIAFDIDGTLYPLMRLHLRMTPHFLGHMRFFYHFGCVRKQLRRTAVLPDLYHYQAILMSERLGISTPEAKKLLNEIIYNGLAKYFDNIKPFKNIEETFQKLKEAGYRIALLSDFPPEQKGALWGLKQYCEKILSAERIGALKPSKYTFGILAMEMKVKPEEILYVGDAKRIDVRGSKNAGMKAAIREPWWRDLLHLHCKEADIHFSNYRQFQKLVLD